MATKKSTVSPRSKRSIATSDGMRRSAEIAAKHGIRRGERDDDGLTRKDRVFRAVLDALAAGVELTPEDAAELLPLESETISRSRFEGYVRDALAVTQRRGKAHSGWPKASEGYKGNTDAHRRRVAALKDDARERPEDAAERVAVKQPRSLVLESELTEAAAELENEGYFDPTNEKDERKRKLREIAQRSGQPEFRERLIGHYNGRCAVTDCDAVEALEACHIAPYRGPQSNRVSNGLLLRADIHTLFDRGLIGIEPRSLTVVLAAPLNGTSYQNLEGVRLRVPDNAIVRPDPNALEQRWKRFQQ